MADFLIKTWEKGGIGKYCLIGLALLLIPLTCTVIVFYFLWQCLKSMKH